MGHAHWIGLLALLHLCSAVAADDAPPAKAEAAKGCDHLLCLTPFRRLRHAAGLNVDLNYAAEGFWNTHGGLSTRHAQVFRGDLLATVNYNTPASIWPGATFHATLEWLHGDSLTNRYVGDWQFVSNADGRNYAGVCEAWYKQQFAHDRGWVKLGIQDFSLDFAYPANGTEFLNSSPGLVPTVPLPTFPQTNWGATLGWQFGPALQVQAAVADSKPGSKLFALVEPTLRYSSGPRPGSLKLGGWWSSNRFAAVDPSNARLYRGALGAYAVWDQIIWQPEGVSDGSSGLGAFVQFGWAPPDRSVVDRHFGVGVQIIGCGQARPCDAAGLGLFTVHFSPGGAVSGDETATELFYKAQVTPWFSLKADLQYVINPGGHGLRNAWVVGLRSQTAF